MSINKPRANRKEKAAHRAPSPKTNSNKESPAVVVEPEINVDLRLTTVERCLMWTGCFFYLALGTFLLILASALFSEQSHADELDLNTPTKVEAVQLEEVNPPVIAESTVVVVPERIVLDMAVLADDDGTVYGKLSTGLVAIELFFTKTSVTEANKIVREIATCLEDGQSKYMVSARKCAEPYVDIPMNIYRFGIIDRVRNFW